jgi:branched-chain amino acid transport system substrate-binding protein
MTHKMLVAVGGSYYCTKYTALAPKVQASVEAYRARFDGEVDVFAALGYEAAQVLLDAIQQAGLTEAAHVQRALLGSAFQGWVGSITFDKAGQTQKNLALIQLEDGAQQFVTYISP